MHCVHCHHDQPDAARCAECGEDPLLEGRYRLEAVIGQGAVATLYRAWDLQGEEAVAIKERHPPGRLDAEAEALFQREARVLSELRHPRIPDYLDAFASGRGRARRHYLVQELVDGASLEEEAARRRYTEAEVGEILAEVGQILAYLHALSPPVVHRDLKPGNIMRRADGVLVLVDFGAVRDHLGGTFGGNTVAGTFGYMAPEQFMGEASPASDVYALGVLAVALLSREEPARHYDHARRLQWRSLVRVSDDLGGLLERMLAEAPEARPTAEEVVGALREGGRRKGSKRGKRRSRGREEPSSPPAPPTPPAPPERTPRGQPPPHRDDHADADALERLADRGRRRKEREALQREAEARAASERRARAEEEAAAKRLREALVGPVAGWILRQQGWLLVSASTALAMVCIFGMGGLFSLLPESWGEGWAGLLLLLVFAVWVLLSMGAAIAAVLGGLRLLARASGHLERRRLQALPFRVDTADYLADLARYWPQARVRLEVELGRKAGAEDAALIRDALAGAGLGGSVREQGRQLVILSDSMDLVSFHGKRLEQVTSHHSRLHAWTRGVLSRVLLPAARRLRIEEVEPRVVGEGD